MSYGTDKPQNRTAQAPKCVPPAARPRTTGQASAPMTHDRRLGHYLRLNYRASLSGVSPADIVQMLGGQAVVTDVQARRLQSKLNRGLRLAKRPAPGPAVSAVRTPQQLAYDPRGWRPASPGVDPGKVTWAGSVLAKLKLRSDQRQDTRHGR